MFPLYLFLQIMQNSTIIILLFRVILSSKLFFNHLNLCSYYLKPFIYHLKSFISYLKSSVLQFTINTYLSKPYIYHLNSAIHHVKFSNHYLLLSFKVFYLLFKCLQFIIEIFLLTFKFFLFFSYDLRSIDHLMSDKQHLKPIFFIYILQFIISSFLFIIEGVLVV